MQMKLKQIVLHQIKREDNNPAELNCSDHLLNEKHPTIIEFMDRLIKSFTSKHPTYGRFEDDKENHPFQKWVEEYHQNKKFLEFTIKAMDTLKVCIQVPKAVGGYVLFSHYEEKQIDYLVTIMLDKSLQFAIDDDNLNIKQLEALAIDKIARANRLNITKWKLETEETYLAFIKGTRDVSNYFQRFIGSTDLTSSKVNGNNLRKALNKYMRINEYNENRKESVSREISTYIEGKIKTEKDVHLDAISAFVNTENPVHFMEFIQNDESIEVSGSFRVARKSDFNFHRAVVVEQGYKLEFEKKLKRDNKIIREGNNIVIKDVPTEILDDEFGTN
jgi:nucleoid-associated protein